MTTIEQLKLKHDLKKGLRRVKFSISKSIQESSELSKQQLKRKINSKAKRTVAQVENMAFMRRLSKPNDWYEKLNTDRKGTGEYQWFDMIVLILKDISILDIT